AAQCRQHAEDQSEQDAEQQIDQMPASQKLDEGRQNNVEHFAPLIWRDAASRLFCSRDAFFLAASCYEGLKPYLVARKSSSHLLVSGDRSTACLIAKSASF